MLLFYHLLSYSVAISLFMQVSQPEYANLFEGSHALGSYEVRLKTRNYHLWTRLMVACWVYGARHRYAVDYLYVKALFQSIDGSTYVIDTTLV